MQTKALTDLIEQLCRPAERYRTGVWLVADEEIGKEEEIVSCLYHLCNPIDMRYAVIQRRPPGARFAGISVENIHAWIDDILQKEISTDCGVLYHLDLLLAYLTATDRERVWDIIQNSLVRRSKALVIAFPQRAIGLLLRENTLDGWRSSGRLADHS